MILLIYWLLYKNVILDFLKVKLLFNICPDILQAIDF